MRQLSADQLKRRSKGKKVRALRTEPKEGTRTRQIYDLFVASPGKPIEFSLVDYCGYHTPLISQIETTYGLDIRLIKQGSSRTNRKSLWVLAGEWFGPIYIDYTADTEEHMDRLVEARYALQHIERVENILPAGVKYLSKDSIEILERVAAKGREILEKHRKDKNNGS